MLLGKCIRKMEYVPFIRVRSLRYTHVIMYLYRLGAYTNTDCSIHGTAVWYIHNISSRVEEVIRSKCCIVDGMYCIMYSVLWTSMYVHAGGVCMLSS